MQRLLFVTIYIWNSDFHTWTLEWTPNELVYKFDGEVTFRHNLNRVIDAYYGPKWTAPFDEYFFVVLNTAIGGDFIDGPDENDVWSYPDAEFVIDSIKITPLEEIVDPAATTCASDSRCSNCRPDTEDCSGTDTFLQYSLKVRYTSVPTLVLNFVYIRFR